MAGIDTSDWNVVVIEIAPSYCITERVLRTEEEEREFCERYGYKLKSFKQGTNPLCKKEAENG